MGRIEFKIVDGVFVFTNIPYGLKTKIQLCPYMMDILNNNEIHSATITPTKLIISYCQIAKPVVQKSQKSKNKKFTKVQKQSKQKTIKQSPGKPSLYGVKNLLKDTSTVVYLRKQLLHQSGNLQKRLKKNKIGKY